MEEKKAYPFYVSVDNGWAERMEIVQSLSDVSDLYEGRLKSQASVGIKKMYEPGLLC